MQASVDSADGRRETTEVWEPKQLLGEAAEGGRGCGREICAQAWRCEKLGRTPFSGRAFLGPMTSFWELTLFKLANQNTSLDFYFILITTRREKGQLLSGGGI